MVDQASRGGKKSVHQTDVGATADRGMPSGSSGIAKQRHQRQSGQPSVARSEWARFLTPCGSDTMKRAELAETLSLSEDELQGMVGQGLPCDANAEFQLEHVLAWMAAHSRRMGGEPGDTAEAVAHVFEP